MKLNRVLARDRRRRKRLTERLLKTPKTLDVILAHIRNGGSLITLCETWEVQYSDFITWIRADKLKSEAYDKAIGDRSEWTDEMILNELRVAANFDMRRLYFQDGPLKGARKKIIDLDLETARMLQEVKLDGTVKAYDRFKALEMLGKNRRLLVDKTELDVGKSLEELLAQSNEPAAAAPAPAAPASVAQPAP